ncbi:MAG: dihydrofolate reductase family protein [Microbacteriaceae bacterium]
MTKTQYYTATSIDGFIADQNNSLDWLFQVGNSDVGEVDIEPTQPESDRFEPFLAEVGAMAMGATTYRWILEHEHFLEEPAKWQRYYGDRPTWVFTHRKLPVIPGADLTFVRGDVRPVHDMMRSAAGGKNIWVIGGGELAGQFLDRGLLDELQLSIAPVLLGGGSPLLPRRVPASELVLSAVEQDKNFVYASYTVVHPSFPETPFLGGSVGG